jgi:hypothetical protein
MSGMKEAVFDILKGLSPVEQALLSGILELEHEKLSQKNPSIKAELLRVVRDTVK